MSTQLFDGFRETMLADYCIDESGRWAPRDDLEAAEECREAYREERRRRKALSDALTFMAIGMLVAVMLVVLGH